MSSLLSKLSLGTRDTNVSFGFVVCLPTFPWFSWPPVFCHICYWLSFHWNVFMCTVMLRTSCWSAFMTAMVFLQKTPPWCLLRISWNSQRSSSSPLGWLSFCSGSLYPTLWFALSPPLALLCSDEKMLKKSRTDSALHGLKSQNIQNARLSKLSTDWSVLFKKITAHLTILIENTWVLESDTLTKIENAMLGSNFLESCKNHLLICHDVGPWPPVLGVPNIPTNASRTQILLPVLGFHPSAWRALDSPPNTCCARCARVRYRTWRGRQSWPFNVSKSFEGILSSSGCGKNTKRGHNDPHRNRVTWHLVRHHGT